MANITNQGVPNVFTEGAIGDIYTDTKTGYKYKCISVITVNTAEGSTPYHTWVRIVENTSSGGSGTDGYSPTVNIEEIDGGHRVTITDVNGDQYFDVLDGEKGDVGLTDEEKEVYDEAINKAHEHINKDIIDSVTQEKIDNWDSKATEDYVDTKVADLVGSAPETMNTLEELATAMENNSEVVEVLDQAITNKADKDGTNATGDWSINITGNAATADSATKATQDANGNNITDTYASKEDLTNTSSEKDITGIAEGECPTITDSTDAPLLYTKIKGYTLQDGTPTPDAPVDVLGLGNNGSVELTACGKNLLDVITVSDTKNGLTITVNDDKSVTINGTATANTTIGIGTNETLRKRILNKEVIFSGSVGGSYNNYLMQIWNYNSNNEFIYSADGDSVPFVFTNSDSDFNLVIYIWSGVTLDNVTFYPMIRLASTEDSTYEPYQGTVATIPIDSPLYEGDYIEEYADGSGKIVRESNLFYCKTIKSYDISRDIALLQFEITNPSDTKRVLAKCNSFIQKLEYNFSYEHFYIEGNVINLFIRKDRFSTGLGNLQSEFTSYIQSNPIYFVYYLATPIETPLTAEQVAQFKNLYSFDNITNLSCDGEVSVQYYKNTDNGKIAKIVEDKVSNGDLSSFDFSTLSDNQVSQLKTQLGLS